MVVEDPSAAVCIVGREKSKRERWIWGLGEKGMGEYLWVRG
jgi:hypothetical protein